MKIWNLKILIKKFMESQEYVIVGSQFEKVLKQNLLHGDTKNKFRSVT